MAHIRRNQTMMDFDFDIQLFGGGGGGGGSSSASEVKSSAPGSTAGATIDSATAGSRQSVRDKLAKAMNRKATVKTGNNVNADALNQLKKQLLGE